MWKHLTHKNILPFKGVTTNPLQLLSYWMPGNVLEYIQTIPDVDRLELVGVPPFELACTDTRYQLSDAANGLSYLHSRNVIHGNLKGVRGYS